MRVQGQDFDLLLQFQETQANLLIFHSLLRTSFHVLSNAQSALCSAYPEQYLTYSGCSCTCFSEVPNPASAHPRLHLLDGFSQPFNFLHHRPSVTPSIIIIITRTAVSHQQHLFVTQRFTQLIHDPRNTSDYLASPRLQSNHSFLATSISLFQTALYCQFVSTSSKPQTKDHTSSIAIEVTVFSLSSAEPQTH